MKTFTGKPLKRCCNGCDAPPQPPSKVLCEACFATLGVKIHALAGVHIESNNCWCCPTVEHHEDGDVVIHHDREEAH